MSIQTCELAKLDLNDDYIFLTPPIFRKMINLILVKRKDKSQVGQMAPSTFLKHKFSTYYHTSYIMNGESDPETLFPLGTEERDLSSNPTEIISSYSGS